MPCLPRHLATLTLIAAAAPSLAACGGIGDLAGVSSGYVSHQLCSAAFTSGLDPEVYYREALAPSLSVAGGLAHHHVDTAARTVTADLAGLARRRAVFTPGLGCRVEHPGDAAPVAIALPPQPPALLPPIAGPDLVTPTDPALSTALDHAFGETPSGPHRFTKAVVVVQDGKLIAERYAPGYGVDTPILGWSMTKSVTNALLGILVREGKISMQGPAPIAAWSDPKDPRHAISLDNLERMASGLDIGQSMTQNISTGLDPTAHMVFDTSDMAAYAERARLKSPPGTAWTYTNGNILLLSRVIRDQVGGDAPSVLRFAHRELFDKLGMTKVTLEFDAAGTPIGSSHMWASARDWARFGMLYLDDGVVGGERILPVGWTDYSARMTPGSETYGYGAGFWTNRGDGDGVRRRVGGGMPTDSYFARGSQGQYTIIIPSRKLVIVRMGMAYTPYDDMDTVARLVREVIAATGG